MQPTPSFRVFAMSACMVSAILLTLAGCSSRQDNKVINSGPDGITMEYDTRYPTMAGVDADEHCAKYGKLAKRVETEKAGTMERVTHEHAAVGVFECVSAP